MNKKIYPLFFLFLICVALLVYLITDPVGKTATVNYANQLTAPEHLDLSKVQGALPEQKKFTVYFNASSLKKLRDGQKIKTWASDAPELPLNLEVITAKSEPTYKAGQKGSHAGVYFDGTTYFEAWSVLGNKIIDPNSVSAVVVFKPDLNSNSPQALTELFGWGDCADNRFLAHVSPGSINFHYGNPNNRVDVTNQALIQGKYNILVLERRENIATVELNNAVVGKMPSSPSLDLTASASLVVGSSTCGHNFHGEIAEFMILKNLSSAEKQSLIKKIITDYKLDF
ncbi:MAG: hypothetical protein ACXVAX_13295 [Pseudobdellovibrio sp.]